jgi:hypothetical protein
MAVPTPPMTAGLVTAAPGDPSSSCWMNWLLSAPTTGTGSLPTVLKALTTV